ncbi:MAG: hypothetical protein JNL82_32410 [Myxococcales bacterium]|nr:hypothetical protein [Myxococcales bacterium]
MYDNDPQVSTIEHLIFIIVEFLSASLPAYGGRRHGPPALARPPRRPRHASAPRRGCAVVTRAVVTRAVITRGRPDITRIRTDSTRGRPDISRATQVHPGINRIRTGAHDTCGRPDITRIRTAIIRTAITRIRTAITRSRRSRRCRTLDRTRRLTTRARRLLARGEARRQGAQAAELPPPARRTGAPRRQPDRRQADEVRPGQGPRN